MSDLYVEHVTGEGERWDQISARYLGTPLAYERIIVANPAVPITVTLPAGTTLRIPLPPRELGASALPDAAALQRRLAAGLPPWKRPVET